MRLTETIWASCFKRCSVIVNFVTTCNCKEKLSTNMWKSFIHYKKVSFKEDDTHTEAKHLVSNMNFEQTVLQMYINRNTKWNIIDNS